MGKGDPPPAQLMQLRPITDDSDAPPTAPPTSPSYENLGFTGPTDAESAPPPYNVNLSPESQKHVIINLSPDVETANGKPRLRHSSSNSSQSDENRKRHISSASMSSLNFDDAVLDENINLVYSKHEHIPSKDFSKEVRGAMDVERYLKNMVVLLDLSETGPDEIVNALLHKMLDGNENDGCYDQARSALFTHDEVHQFSKTMQCASFDEGALDYEQNWIIAMASLPSLQTRHVGITRLKHAANLGWTCQEVHFVVLILAPTKEKSTKSALETARTFATMFSDIDFRQNLYNARGPPDFQRVLEERMAELSRQKTPSDKPKLGSDEEEVFGEKKKCRVKICKGLVEDLRRRLPHYWSDYKDGVADLKSVQKTVSATFFLYFACVLPSIAFGVLNDNNTKHYLNVEKVFYSQFIGGLFFAIVGGTPQIVLLTTAPLALYTKIIYSISDEFQLDFPSMFCLVGLWNTFFLVVYSVFGLSTLMKFSTRSSEEIFALFISIAFSVDAFKDLSLNFAKYYSSELCNATMLNATGCEGADCQQREVSMLYLFLLFGTLWVGVTLFNFTKTPFLTAGKREFLADYALPVAVLIMSFLGSYVFRHICASTFGYGYGDEDEKYELFRLVPFSTLSVGAVFGAMGLGFCLSLLFFMDQNISAALVNAPQNKMKKGTAYHWDLLVIGLVNGVLSLFCLPWVHAALPHSPLHVRALADVEERVDQGHIHQIVVRVRETRLTAIFSHILIALSLLFLQHLTIIPTAVLYGLFLYVAVTALYDNQFFERVLLYVTEQAAYPPNHYVRRVPQRKMHLFTLTQIIQLGVLCIFGFYPYPYLKMFFPVLIFLLIPVRHLIIPKLIDKKYLDAIDAH